MGFCSLVQAAKYNVFLSRNSEICWESLLCVTTYGGEASAGNGIILLKSKLRFVQRDGNVGRAMSLPPITATKH